MEVFDLGHPLLNVEDDKRGGNKAHGEDDADGVQHAVIRKYNYPNYYHK
jgi:hypothetical protein